MKYKTALLVIVAVFVALLVVLVERGSFNQKEVAIPNTNEGIKQEERVSVSPMEEESAISESAGYAFTVDGEYCTSDEYSNVITIQAHIKDVMVDEAERICISSDTDEYPGAFVVIVSDSVYDKKQLCGGQNILVTMQDTGEKSGSMPVCEALYLLPIGEDVTGM